MLNITSIKNAEHYTWGNACDGWHLLKSDSLSVIQERMPPATGEQLHYHHFAQQVFYILSGTATFKAGDHVQMASAGESVHIPANTKHQISNESNADLHFLVISEPKSYGDRVNL